MSVGSGVEVDTIAGRALATRLVEARFGDAMRVAGLRAAGFRAAGFRAAGFLVRGLRRAGAAGDVTEVASLRICVLNASRRLIALSRSACRAVRSRRACTCLIAVWTVFWPSLTVRSICFRTSGGTRFSA